MKYLIKTNSTDRELLETIDKVIEYIIKNGNNQFIEKDGYLYEVTNMSRSISILDALKKMKMKLLRISDILGCQLIDIRDVTNLLLEDSDIIVLTTKNNRTIKVQY